MLSKRAVSVCPGSRPVQEPPNVTILLHNSTISQLILSKLLVKAGANKVDFGEKLRKLRKESGLTQKQLADRLGLAKSIVNYYENGSRYPSYDVLVKLARIFHVSTDYLLGISTIKSIDVTELNDNEIEVIMQMIEILKSNK